MPNSIQTCLFNVKGRYYFSFGRSVEGASPTFTEPVAKRQTYYPVAKFSSDGVASSLTD